MYLLKKIAEIEWHNYINERNRKIKTQELPLNKYNNVKQK